MHQDFRVGFARQMEVRLGQNLLAQLGVIRELSVEGETEPLRLFDVVPLKGLRIAAVVLAARGVADMPDGRRPRILPHQSLVLLSMMQVKDLVDRPDVLVRIDQLVAIGVEGRHAGGELAAVLDIQQHARDQSRALQWIAFRSQAAHASPLQVVDGGDPAFVEQFGHGRNDLRATDWLGTSGAGRDSAGPARRLADVFPALFSPSASYSPRRVEPTIGPSANPEFSRKATLGPFFPASLSVDRNRGR